MTIRFATVEDIPALVALGKRMHAITRFKRLEYREERVARSPREASQKGAGRYVCFVAESGSKQVVRPAGSAGATDLQRSVDRERHALRRAAGEADEWVWAAVAEGVRTVGEEPESDGNWVWDHRRIQG